MAVSMLLYLHKELIACYIVESTIIGVFVSMLLYLHKELIVKLAITSTLKFAVSMLLYLHKELIVQDYAVRCTASYGFNAPIPA